MRAESVSVADCLLWKREGFQSRVPLVPKLLIALSGVTAGISKAPAVRLGSASCLPTAAQCIKRVILPQCCRHVCVCDVLPDPRIASLSSLCLYSLSNVPFGMREHRRQGRPVCRTLGLWDGGRVAPSLCSPPPFPGCMMEGGVLFLTRVHNHGPTPALRVMGLVDVGPM